MQQTIQGSTQASASHTVMTTPDYIRIIMSFIHTAPNLVKCTHINQEWRKWAFEKSLTVQEYLETRWDEFKRQQIVPAYYITKSTLLHKTDSCQDENMFDKVYVNPLTARNNIMRLANEYIEENAKKGSNDETPGFTTRADDRCVVWNPIAGEEVTWRLIKIELDMIFPDGYEEKPVGDEMETD
ncbi:hypothetical protein BGZ65_013008 [Modicella reniformis]|uniref:Uncharacterized protein n=1 Tax=Modicella reniformis TaxID=1440133 RepID=A0A9P6J2S3_9FUNG|nr:hypothetical protein BGZ65_013008 [Modicella reniformis]